MNKNKGKLETTSVRGPPLAEDTHHRFTGSTVKRNSISSIVHAYLNNHQHLLTIETGLQNPYLDKRYQEYFINQWLSALTGLRQEIVLSLI